LKLYTREWLPERTPQAVVCLVHGLGEHSGRYDEVAEVLTDNGFALSAFDLRGHGKSPGQRGHIESYELFMEDIQCLLDEVGGRFPGTPVYLYGQSLGGNLVLNFALRRKSKVAGVIATAPWLRLAFEPPKTGVLLARLMNFVYPAFSHVCNGDVTALSRDPAVVQQYTEDPLAHDLISAKLFVSASQAATWALRHAAEIRLPVLVMHGNADQVTCVEASRQFAARAGRYCTLKIWDGCYHELHHEPEKTAAISYMLAWLKNLKKPELNPFPNGSSSQRFSPQTTTSNLPDTSSVLLSASSHS
jgi:alpha-beta hydrolase superfamily lysophospholipase